MTESEAWDSLADHLQDKNYTGVLVIADWFQENGKGEVADYLKWAIKKNAISPPPNPNYWWRIWPVNRQNYEYQVPLCGLAVSITEEAMELAELREWCSD